MARTQHTVCPAAELQPGTRRIVSLNGISVGVFNVGGTLHAIRNSCPHRGAPLCEGTIGGTMMPSDPQHYVYGMEGRLLRCPWHGWEIDIASGKPTFNDADRRVRTYAVEVVDGQVVVEV
jgi:3-phenylpropionate/trans-cinnamate dioxygenase ferredoxin subunit